MAKDHRKLAQDGLLSVKNKYQRISELGDKLEVLDDRIDFEIFTLI